MPCAARRRWPPTSPSRQQATPSIAKLCCQVRQLGASCAPCTACAVPHGLDDPCACVLPVIWHFEVERPEPSPSQLRYSCPCVWTASRISPSPRFGGAASSEALPASPMRHRFLRAASGFEQIDSRSSQTVSTLALLCNQSEHAPPQSQGPKHARKLLTGKRCNAHGRLSLGGPVRQADGYCG